MTEKMPETTTIIERTINGSKVIAFVRCPYDSNEGDNLVEVAERQDSRWGVGTIDRVTVCDSSLIPPDNQFAMPGGGISSAEAFDIRDLAEIMHILGDRRLKPNK